MGFHLEKKMSSTTKLSTFLYLARNVCYAIFPNNGSISRDKE